MLTFLAHQAQQFEAEKGASEAACKVKKQLQTQGQGKFHAL